MKVHLAQGHAGVAKYCYEAPGFAEFADHPERICALAYSSLGSIRRYVVEWLELMDQPIQARWWVPEANYLLALLKLGGAGRDVFRFRRIFVAPVAETAGA